MSYSLNSLKRGLYRGLARGLLWGLLDSRSLDYSSYALYILHIWGFPKFRGAFVGVSISRILVFCDLYWGSSPLFWEITTYPLAPGLSIPQARLFLDRNSNVMVSINRRTSVQTLIYCNPYYRDPERYPVFWGTLNPKPRGDVRDTSRRSAFIVSSSKYS